MTAVGIATTPAADLPWQAGLGLRAGPTLTRRGWRFESSVDFRLITGSSDSQNGRMLSLRERGVGIGIAATRRRSRLALGVALRLNLRLISALAEVGPQTERVSQVIPAMEVAGALRIHLSRMLALSALVGVEASAVRQRFTILGQPMADLGRLRGFLHLGLVYDLR